jgi:CheY-like chemotaxis protein
MDRTVLYVEDEESDVFLLKHAFNTIGVLEPFKVAIDGEEAIRYLAGDGPYADRRAFPFPCLMLLDLNLPRKNGFEVLQWRNDHSVARTPPVVVYTSSESPQDIDRAYELGAAAYLIKHPDLEDWVRRARVIREFWLVQNTLPLACFQANASSVPVIK